MRRFVWMILNMKAGKVARTRRGLKKKRNAVFPAKLQGQFGKLRWYHPADPPDFLNYASCEFLMIDASDDIKEDLGLDLEGEVREGTGESCSDLIKMLGEVASAKPLLEGTGYSLFATTLTY
ncbi:hypothetical protein QQ045_010471 [Rhodiola kirilowii]